MAPIPETLSTTLHTLLTALTRRTTTSPILPRDNNDNKDSSFVHGSGTIQPTHVPTNAIFALIGIICAGFVVTAIWFFFIAKNGGFHFRKGDWEDYKSTVLRRKGPNGTTLSGATRSTDLGGGSVVGKRYRDSDSSGTSSLGKSEQEESLVGTETVVSEMTSITRGVSGRFQKEKAEKNKKKAGKTERKRFREKGDKREKSRLRDEESAVGADDDMPDEAIRSYRHEKSARVGGMNRAPDGSAFGSSADGSQESRSELLANREATPTNSPQKIRKSRDGGAGHSDLIITGSPGGRGGGIRKVETVREQDRIKAEARRLREKGRSSMGGAGPSRGGRRDFSYTPGDDVMSAVSERSERSDRSDRERRLPGSYVESDAGSGETGTKSYRHVIPGLSSVASGDGYVEERRRRRAER